MSTDSNPRLLHVWPVTITQEVPESAEETVNGQKVTVTRKALKPVTTRMGLRAPGRREGKDAELFRASRIAFYCKPPHNLLLASELTNRLINNTGGVLTDQEKARVKELRAKHVELDMDLARGATTLSADEKKKLNDELAAVRAELINLNSVNEELYNQTADYKAEKDLNQWLTFKLIMVEKSGKWTPYFEGKTFEEQEDFMWDLEDKKDEFYLAAVDPIATWIYWLSKGVKTPEQFKLIADEMEAQRKAREEEVTKVAEEPAKNEPAPAPAAPAEVKVEEPAAAT